MRVHLYHLCMILGMSALQAMAYAEPQTPLRHNPFDSPDMQVIQPVTSSLLAEQATETVARGVLPG